MIPRNIYVTIMLKHIISIILVITSYSAFASNTCLIIANGSFDKKLVLNLINKKPTIVALDGAANNLIRTNIVPDYILGDFDSISDHAENYFKNKDVPFISTPDQNHTDLEKGVLFCKEKGAKEILITCALGGDRTDHLFGNLSLLRRQYDKTKTTKIQILTNGEVIEFLKNETIEFTAPKGEKFGLFGFPKATASSKGLMWELDNYPLELGFKESSCNILKDSEVQITVKGEALMIRPL